MDRGCPQHIAKRGNFGSFLQDDWELVADPEKSALNGHEDLEQGAWKPLLQEYCSAFQKCIERFSSNYKNHGGIAALDSMMDAYEKSRKRIERP